MGHERHVDDEALAVWARELDDLIRQHTRTDMTDPMDELQSEQEALYLQWERTRAQMSRTRDC